MIYIALVPVTFLLLVFFVSKFNKKYNFYRNDESDKATVIFVILLISLLWFVTLPLLSVFLFFYFVVKNSIKFLK
jgi:hypothetical protein